MAFDWNLIAVGDIMYTNAYPYVGVRRQDEYMLPVKIIRITKTLIFAYCDVLGRRYRFNKNTKKQVGAQYDRRVQTLYCIDEVEDQTKLYHDKRVMCDLVSSFNATMLHLKLDENIDYKTEDILHYILDAQKLTEKIQLKYGTDNKTDTNTHNG